jgi:hypothetical protein
MSEFVIFSCSGLLVYWAFRALLLLKGSEEEIHETLEADVWWVRSLLLAIRTTFGGPTQLAG